jgi:uncharacterized protein YkwD
MFPKFTLLTLALGLAACTVQPLTPTPETIATLPPPSAAISTFTPAPTVIALPIETAPPAASPTPEILPSPTETAPLAVGVQLAVVASPTEAVPLPPADTAAPPVVAAPPPSDDVAAAEQYTIDLINARRAAAGVAPLARDETLMSIARARVADMVARGYTGHTDPVTGEHLARAMMRAAGYTSNYLGENWYGSIQSPSGLADTAMGWFMTDPPHANNILGPNYAWVGVGIAFNGRQWLLVQTFAGANL